MKYIKGQSRQQITLFPVSLDDAVEVENEVRLIEVFVESLKLEEFGFKTDFIENGRPAYHPADLLKLYIYGYLNRVRSSRQLEKESKRNIEVMWLLKRLQPDHNTISNFRRDNPKAIKKADDLGIDVMVAIPTVAANAPNPEYNVENFAFDKINDCYTCPEGEKLVTNGRWHQAKTYRFKRYTTTACKTCPAKPECSKAICGKAIQRSEFQEYIDNNKKRIEQNPDYYRKRQAIVEHPGVYPAYCGRTIKRQWGFNYILTKKGINRASADVGLIMTVYNLRRIINIVGLKELKNYLKEVITFIFQKIVRLRLNISNINELINLTENTKTILHIRLKRLYLI